MSRGVGGGVMAGWQVAGEMGLADSSGWRVGRAGVGRGGLVRRDCGRRWLG